MIEVYFENCCGQERVIARTKNKSESFSKIAEFLEEHDYTAYYYRYALHEDEKADRWFIKIDVGSHTEFFKIYFNTRGEADGFLSQDMTWEGPF